MRPSFVAVLSFVLTLFQAIQPAFSQQLNPQEQRISDQKINADYKTYEAQQNAIRDLNNGGKHKVASYALSKAQCWLDVSFHEYSRNDRSAFPQESLRESHRITSELKAGDDSLSAKETPLVNKASRIREDLWARAGKLKGVAGFSCAAQQTACAEVELAHAGHEINQYGGNAWRHAKPYIQIAEDLIERAEVAAAKCEPLPVAKASLVPVDGSGSVAVVPMPAPVEAAPSAVVSAQVLEKRENVSLSANVLFNFDKRSMDQARAMSVERLDRVLEQARQEKFKSVTLSIVGHADRTTNKADDNYNADLSLDRAKAVEAYIAAKGVKVSQVKLESRAASQPVKACEGAMASAAHLRECLLPNRRVEVLIEAEN